MNLTPFKKFNQYFIFSFKCIPWSFEFLRDTGRYVYRYILHWFQPGSLQILSWWDLRGFFMKEGFVKFKQSTERQTCLTPLHSLLHSTPHSTATEWWVNIWFFFYFQKAFDSLCLSSYIKKFQPFWLTFYARIFSSELFKRFKVRVAAILFQKICFRMKFIFLFVKLKTCLEYCYLF